MASVVVVVVVVLNLSFCCSFSHTNFDAVQHKTITTYFSPMGRKFIFWGRKKAILFAS